MARLKGSKDKKTRKKRTKNLLCQNDHDIATVGRNSSGNCRQCRKEYDKERREFVKKYFNKQP